MLRRLPLALGLAAALACSASESDRAGSPTASGDSGASAPRAGTVEGDRAALVERGSVIYHSTCIACHAADPNQAGGLGPPIAGSPLELLRAKVLRNAYPPGYTPKRDTSNMVPLPYLEEDLPAIAAYLDEAAG